MANLNCVLIGCGSIGREHLIALADLNKITVAAVCDVSDARAEATAERFGIVKWYSDYEEMLRHIRPDLVHITTPPSAHYSIARRCLTAGLNVLCEKPITVEYREFSELKQLAIQNRCILMENQNYRFHSSIQRIQALVTSGAVGDILEVQILLFLNLFGHESAYVDRNAPYFGLNLRGGVIGDFLPHLAGLSYMFTGRVVDLRTIWKKQTANSPLFTDEFRGLIKGERASAFVEFSGNTQPDGFWVRILGTRMQIEANLFSPPLFTVRRLRKGEPALMRLVDGITEARDVLAGTVAAFWRKLAGVSRYDGLRELISRIYDSLERQEAQPIPLDEIDDIARLVDNFTRLDLQL